MTKQATQINKGGRPPKAEKDRATIKLNCWVTPEENLRLQTEYTLAKAGKKLTFSQFIKQILLDQKLNLRLKKEELLLTIIINLQEEGRQLDDVKALLEAQLEEDSRKKIHHRIEQELVRIQETITQITRWLYES